MIDNIQILYTFTTPVFYSKTGENEASYEFYWDPLLQEGGLRNSKTKRNTPLIRGIESNQMYVSTLDELLEVIATHKRANNIKD